MSEPNYKCHFCGDPVDPNQIGVYKRVTGWVENRKSGGAHAVALPSPPTGYACRICMEIKRSKSSRGQRESLF